MSHSPSSPESFDLVVIGAGPIVIGQACEFDYSGAQACKALKEEGFRVILVNSNPATIMTDPDTADSVYIEPIHWTAVEKIIEKERPDALLPTMGGQTALNLAVALGERGEQHVGEVTALLRDVSAEDHVGVVQGQTLLETDLVLGGLDRDLAARHQLAGPLRQAYEHVHHLELDLDRLPAAGETVQA